jgi:coenzyme F420-reducing hydrogenase alpha subunit
MKNKTRHIQVGTLTRVEGDGGFRVDFPAEGPPRVRLAIHEAPRLFEGFLCGRESDEAPDLTARICGICPVAHQLAAARAVEAAGSIEPDDDVARLRRILLCGEWLESHALHVYFLHAPDFFDCPDALALGQRDPKALQRGLALKKAGNALVAMIGGREVHPVNFRVGGFYRLPDRAELQSMGELLQRALELALETVRWTAGFEIPAFLSEFEALCIDEGDRYPMIGDRIRTESGRMFAAADFENQLSSRQLPYSTALQYRLSGSALPLLTGPLARYNLNAGRLSAAARQAAAEAGLKAPVCNPYHSIVVRGVEMVHACEEALAALAAYRTASTQFSTARPIDAFGAGAVEAPRGLLLHRFRIDKQGIIRQAKIVTPTALNQHAVEADLQRAAGSSVETPTEALQKRCETVVRNHDPCISCAVH